MSARSRASDGPSGRASTPARSRGGPCPQRVGVEFPDEGDVAYRKGPLLGPEIAVVHAERLLEDGGVGALRDGHEDGIDVAHIMTPDDVGAVGETPRVPVVGGPE